MTPDATPCPARPVWVPPAVPSSSAAESQARNLQQRIRATQYALRQQFLHVQAEGLNDKDTDGLDLERWEERMKECNNVIEVKACDNGHARVRGECCKVPCCPREMRRRSNHWQTRAEHLAMKYKGHPTLQAKLITLSLRHKGEGLAVDVEKAIQLRRRLMRHLKNVHGMVAAFAAIEFSQGEHVHLHCLVWSEFVPREQLQSWLRSQDCTIPHCPHPHDDRCEVCREAKCECQHPDGARTRCSGSYMLDIRRAWDAKEAIKYACAPVIIDNPNALTKTEIENARTTVLFFIASYNRHKVETYGEAKAIVDGEDQVRADGEQGDDLDRAKQSALCHCGCSLNTVCLGYSSNKNYRFVPVPKGMEPISAWKPPPPGATSPRAQSLANRR